MDAGSQLSDWSKDEHLQRCVDEGVCTCQSVNMFGQSGDVLGNTEERTVNSD